MKNTKVILIVLGLILLLTACTNKSVSEVENGAIKVSIDEAKELIENEGDLFILDVRTKEEFDEAHIEGAVQIPVDELEARLVEIEEYKDAPLLVYCRSGNRSSVAVEILLENDFTKINHMSDGFMNWK